MRRSTFTLSAVVGMVLTCLALAAPASAEILLIGHGGERAQALPAPPHPSFSGGVHERGGMPMGAPDQQAAPPVARYLVESTTSFTLDMSGPVPLLRYSNSSEVWALKPQAAPRGDVLYTNDAGETVLRATRLGGLTVFTPDQPTGVAASLMGSAQPIIALPDIRSEVQLLFRMGQSSDHLSRMAGHTIGFVAGDEADPDLGGPESFPLVADTVNVAMDAFNQAFAPKNAKRKSIIPRLDEVRIKKGVPPDAYFKDDTLVLVITPSRGVAGRPSSQKIFKVLFR